MVKPVVHQLSLNVSVCPRKLSWPYSILSENSGAQKQALFTKSAAIKF